MVAFSISALVDCWMKDAIADDAIAAVDDCNDSKDVTPVNTTTPMTPLTSVVPLKSLAPPKFSKSLVLTVCQYRQC